MRTHKQLERSNGRLRSKRLAISAIAAGALAATTGAVAAQGHASPHRHAYRRLHGLGDPRTAQARLQRGLCALVEADLSRQFAPESGTKHLARLSRQSQLTCRRVI